MSLPQLLFFLAPLLTPAFLGAKADCWVKSPAGLAGQLPLMLFGVRITRGCTPPTSPRPTTPPPPAAPKISRKAYEKKEKLVEKYDIKKSFAKMNYTDEEYRTVEQILFRPVPYDAERSNNQDEFQKLLKQKISGTNHRAYTLGHDPILGWVIGPINILTRSVTFKNPPLVTFPVQERGNIITLPKSSIIYEIQVALDSVQDDSSRLAAAIAKQALHFASDKYTKGGLPIPFFSAEKAQKLIDKNWNSVEAEKWIKKAKHSFANDSTAIALQFFIAHYINELIRVIHIMLCEEDTDSNSEFFEVRTKRIISLSNVIASTSNVVYAIAKAYISQDPIKGVQVLDFGGIIESLRQVISNSIFISKIKDEYIKSKINEDFQNCLDKLEI